MPTISLSNEFMQCLSNLPREVQKKAIAFTEKFRKDPRSAGINYEVIRDARDSRIRSCRVDLDYRAIVLSPESGDVYMLLWVAKHDDAYAWARRRTATVNPLTGSLQIVVANEIAEELLPAREMPVQPPLFAALARDQALALGVPEANLPLLQLLRTEEDLVALAPVLPQEAFEALQLVASGESVESVLELIAQTALTPVAGEEGIVLALRHQDSMRRFVTVTDDAQLQQMLDAPLQQWRVFLHPSQRSLVQMRANGPVKVLGGPGTGKTVVALHRACTLARRSLGARVLLTTFTRNLAVDLEHMRSDLDASTSNVKVQNIDSWVVGYLRENGVAFEPMNDEDQAEAWMNAMPSDTSGLTVEILQREWRDVILAQGIGDEDTYFRASRTGLRGRLDRLQRQNVWAIVKRYRGICEEDGRLDWLSMHEVARKVIEKSGQPPFDHVVVDEAQDLHPATWRLIRALVAPCADDIFIVGDAHQRIYGRKIVLSRLGIDTRGRSRRLKLNYRTTHEIKAWATAIFKGISVDDLDDAADELKGYTSLVLGEKPLVLTFTTEEEERDYLERFLHNYESAAFGGLCIAARSKTVLDDRVQPLLQSIGIPHGVLSGYSRPEEGSVSLATFHRVKGTEFRVVVLVGVEEGLVPLTGHDETREELDRERSLLFVAATRAREGLVCTAVGEQSSFLR